MILTRMACKAAYGDRSSMEITISHAIGTRHALFISYTLGSIATPTSSFIILGTDFLINLYSSIKLLWVKKKNPLNIEKQIEIVQDLVIAEMIEFVVPIVYILTFITAYFGPNAEIIGNIGNSYWQYNAVIDVGHTLQNLVIIFFIDLGSLIISAFILWTFGRINIYRAFSFYQKEYGLVFMINVTFIFYSVST